MTQETHTYQAMFLLDNQEVRQNGFNAVREQVKTTLEKHGLTAKVLRLWGERKLAYPVGARSRATFLLGWLEGSGGSVNQAKKDFYLVGPVFRCLFLRAESISDEELAFGIEEIDDSAVVIPDETAEVVEEEVAVGAEAPVEAKEEAKKEVKEETKEEAGEPAVPAEEPAVPAEEPAVSAEEPAVPAEEPAVPAEEPAAPAEEPAAPAEEPAAPAEEGGTESAVESAATAKEEEQ